MLIAVNIFNGPSSIFGKKQQSMKALKFYDQDGTAFEFYMDYDKETVMLQVEEENHPDVKHVAIDENDIDDIIIALADLKTELIAIRNISNN